MFRFHTYCWEVLRLFWNSLVQVAIQRREDAMHLAAECCSGGLDRRLAALLGDARRHGVVDELEAEPDVEELLRAGPMASGGAAQTSRRDVRSAISGRWRRHVALGGRESP